MILFFLNTRIAILACNTFAEFSAFKSLSFAFTILDKKWILFCNTHFSCNCTLFFQCFFYLSTICNYSCLDIPCKYTKDHIFHYLTNIRSKVYYIVISYNYIYIFFISFISLLLKKKVCLVRDLNLIRYFIFAFLLVMDF